MYDSARDTFTPSDDAPTGENPQKDEAPAAAPPRKERSSDYASPIPMTTANLPRFARKRQDHGSDSRSPRPSRRSPDPNARKRRRSPTPPSRRSHSPRSARRTPTPPPRSPPRKLKRPGGASRINAAEKEAVRQRQVQREQEKLREAEVAAATRGVHDVVRQHYNAVPERGRDWRKTDSRIKGLRSFNNWVKSTIIQKFSPNEDYTPGGAGNSSWAEGLEGGGMHGDRGIIVLDVGCGKGGDLGKWQQAPQRVDLYVGVDPAEISIEQARERYAQMVSGGGRGGRGGRGGFRGGRPQRVLPAEFFVKDAFGEWLGDIPIIQEVGIDPNSGPAGGAMNARWGGGGFDVVSMMFCMHYAFENEEKARGMLRNVAGCLKKGGRFLGVIPNSDVHSAKAIEYHKRKAKEEPNGSGGGQGASSDGQDGAAEDKPEEGEVEEGLEWGNSIYRVRFPGKTPDDGTFRPPFGWRYSYFMQEAVEEVPEYVVPWEAFRAIADDYNLELQYRKPFLDIWNDEKDDPILGPLSERMGVRGRGRGPLLVSDEEMEAAGFYHAFCFYKV
ncbi:guanine-N(7)-methyltransferase [Xylona heveae TC161]|uniref:mRNA cap guanine-N(7) methyltransferase n=1 Tax=Xylona heveae (strain CBS 132557 / TC161) TaxID=1328760 RepID=A0A165FIN0_XYLHT|nr:guanine-N(7)-methyltransferase [Xylona heveae TC161]KZF21020.1 guanine-N(7)-methyltransferase [Xylona heveae TC161]